MVKKEAILAARAAYDIEEACIREMKDYIDDDQFAKAVDEAIEMWQLSQG